MLSADKLSGTQIDKLINGHRFFAFSEDGVTVRVPGRQPKFLVPAVIRGPYGQKWGAKPNVQAMSGWTV